jgi:hypothetical protein
MALAFSSRFAFPCGLIVAALQSSLHRGRDRYPSRRRWKTELKHVGKIQPSDLSDRAIAAILQEFRYLTAEHSIIE